MKSSIVSPTSGLEILHCDETIEIYTNPRTKEFFIRDKRTALEVKIGAAHYSGIEISTDGHVEPCISNGKICWRVRPR